MLKQKKTYSIEWDINEFERFKELIKNIASRSEILAQKIKDKVKGNINLIKQNPEMFEVDSSKINNDGTYRKFNVIHIRFAYKIDNDKIIIARVRHSSSDPTEY